ncbi:MAG: Crp/Fnr family transcriptional regulator [Actinomycetota bacterium]
MNAEAAAGLLGSTDLFKNLDPPVLDQLARSVTFRNYRRGHLIFAQGEPGDSLFVISEGLVKVFVTSEEGEDMVLVTLRPPETFGELALIDGGLRSASAEALEPTTTLTLSRGTLIELLQRHPNLAQALLSSLGGLVRRLTEQAADLVFLDLHGRVAKLLLTLAEERGRHEGLEVLLDLQVTQGDLAAMVGGSRQSVNHILHAFQRRGYLEIEGRRIALKDLTALAKRAGL